MLIITVANLYIQIVFTIHKGINIIKLKKYNGGNFYEWPFY